MAVRALLRTETVDEDARCERDLGRQRVGADPEPGQVPGEGGTLGGVAEARQPLVAAEGDDLDRAAPDRGRELGHETADDGWLGFLRGDWRHAGANPIRAISSATRPVYVSWLKRGEV